MIIFIPIFVFGVEGVSFSGIRAGRTYSAQCHESVMFPCVILITVFASLCYCVYSYRFLLLG